MSRPVRPGLIGVGLIFLYYWSAQGTDVSVSKLIAGMPAVADLLRRMWPPDLAFLKRMIGPMVETVHIALLGTVTGALLSVPVIVLAAENTNTIRPLRWLARTVMNGVRTMPDVLLAAIFVALVGIGPVAGVAALSVFSFGIISKLTFEALETVDPRPLEAVRAVGAPWPAWLSHAVVPLVLPQFLGVLLYMFEVNVRVATVLGLVGAGGIGLWLMRTLTFFQYGRALAIIMLTFAVVLAIDKMSGALRRRLT